MRYFLVFLFFIVFSVSSLYANDDLPEPMSPPRLVNDFANVFTSSQQRDLENILQAYHDSTTTQIYVVTVNSLGGDAPYHYAARLGNKWGIGQKGKDNGVLILIKPKKNDERGEVFIATGYGTEARLNDAAVGRIIDNKMIPPLIDNNYYKATEQAIYAIIARLSGEFTNDGEDEISLLGVFLGTLLCCILPVVLVIFLIIKFGRKFVEEARTSTPYRHPDNDKPTYRHPDNDDSKPTPRPPKQTSSFSGGGGGRSGGGGAGRSW